MEINNSFGSSVFRFCSLPQEYKIGKHAITVISSDLRVSLVHIILILNMVYIKKEETETGLLFKVLSAADIRSYI